MRFRRVSSAERPEFVDEDVALVQRCLAGDGEAVRLIVERFQGLVFGLCWRMLGQREDAEDVCQESFARIFRHLSQWDRSRPLRPWVMAIVANRCRTKLAKRIRIPQNQAVEYDAVAQVDHRSDLGEELQRGVERLREDHRLCFVMFYHQQMTIEEISAALECPEGTVKTWLYRARKQLAEELLERGVVNKDGYEL